MLIDIIKQNLRFVKVSIFLLKFKLQIFYKFNKFYIVLNILNCLLSHNNINKCLNAFDINTFNAYNDSVIMIFKNFNNYMWKMYEKNTI